MPPPALRAALAAALRRAAAAAANGASPVAAPSALTAAPPTAQSASSLCWHPRPALPFLARAAATTARPPRAPHTNASVNSPEDRAARWRIMLEKGHAVNPCNSPLHPAVSEAGILPDSSQPELCLQEAYTPESTCWGCGPAAEDGLHLRSKRVENGLEARVTLDGKYASFPGVINGGVVATLVDCLSNWTAATHLMDTSALPKPPLTLTASMLVAYREPTPPGTELLVRSQVVRVQEHPSHLGKTTVEVDVAVYSTEPEGPFEAAAAAHERPEGPGARAVLPPDEARAIGAHKLLVTGTVISKRLGASRAL